MPNASVHSSLAAPDWEAVLDRLFDGAADVDVHFQPIIHLREAFACGYEALARFPAASASSPEGLFAAADRLGRVRALEARVVSAVLDRRAAVPENAFLTLNVRPENLLHSEIQDVLASQGDLRGIVIEVTEQTAVDDYEALSDALVPLRALGLKVAVDDAGAGYSSLRHIVALEPEFVKLDRSLIARCDTDPRNVAAISAIGAFAGELDAWVIAEGVETGAELTTLLTLEVPLAQGFFLGRPHADMRGASQEAQDHLTRPSIPLTEGVASLVQTVATVGPGEAVETAMSASVATEVAVRLDEFERPAALLVQRERTVAEFPVMCTPIETPARDLALRAMARPDGTRFLPVACCDSRGRLLGLVPIDRLVGRLARN